MLSERISVVLVEPKYEGNIGAVARLLKNSGLKDLRLVNPPEIGDEGFARSMGGRDLLLLARRFGDLESSVRDFSVVAATSSEKTFSDRKFLRLSMTPWEFWSSNINSNSRIALVFGREDDGLRNAEIEKCNAFIHIPANPEYPVFNLSHAVSIILYEMIRQIPDSTVTIPEPVKPSEMSLLIDRIEEILRLYSYPDYKMENGKIMISRILSRSNLTESEFYKIMGILRLILRNEDNTKQMEILDKVEDESP